MGFFVTLGNDIQATARNPFGFDGEIRNNELCLKNPLGTISHIVGYNDAFERYVGIARVALGILGVLFSDSKQDKAIAAAHIVRGVLEMGQSYEGVLFALDMIATVYNIGNRFFNQKDKAVSACC